MVRDNLPYLLAKSKINLMAQQAIIYILCLDVIHVDAFSSSENPVGGSSRVMLSILISQQQSQCCRKCQRSIHDHAAVTRAAMGGGNKNDAAGSR